jgi:CheY-like chemotaxis protein
MQPTVVPSANQAKARLLEAASIGEPFPVVLLDAMMPGTDGFQLAQWIKNHPELGTTMLLMLSSAGRPGDAGRCKELGISRYLTKPIKQSELLDALLDALHFAPERAEPQAAAAVSKPAAQALKILLAEDNAVNQRLASRLLEKMGHSVTVAANGVEALAALDAENFDLVLMDVQMPEMDGLTAATAIRAKEAANGQRVPIIAMTAHAMKGDRERCLAAGMDDYVPKPIQARELQAAVERYSCHTACKPAAEAAPAAEPTAATLDAQEALRFVGGDAALLQELVSLFLTDYPRLLCGIKDSVATGDAKKLMLHAHTMKGTIGHFAAAAAGDLADQLQVLGHRGTVAGAAELTDALEKELNRIIPTLQAWAKCT